MRLGPLDLDAADLPGEGDPQVPVRSGQEGQSEVRANFGDAATHAARIDRERAKMPAAYEGTPKQPLWEAFQSGAPMPLGERQLRNIIA